MAEALASFPPGTTKAQVIRSGLELLVRVDRQRQGLRWLAETQPLADLLNPEVRAAARG